MSEHEREDEQSFREKVAEANSHALKLQGKYLNLKEQATDAKKDWEFAVVRLQSIIAKETAELPLFDRPATLGEAVKEAFDEAKAKAEAEAEPAKKPRKRKGGEA